METTAWKIGWVLLLMSIATILLTFWKLKTVILEKEVAEKKLERCIQNWENLEPQIKSKRIILELK